MEPGQHPDPLEEALSAASQRVAQIASLAAAGAQVYMQRRALREAGQAASDEHAARLLREHNRLATQQARLTWMPAHDQTWLAHADLEQAGRAWVAAASHADTEPTAASAMRKSEDRLRQLHPYAMTRYDRLRADGADPFDAMRQAAPLFARSPRTHTGQPAPARLALPAQVNEHQPVDSPAPDDPAEPGPDSDPREQAKRRGQHIAERLQDRARATGRPPLGPDELTTVLETITNLPDEVIAAIASQDPGTGHAHPANDPSTVTPVIAPANGDISLPGVATDPSGTNLTSTALPASPTGRSPAQLAADSFPHTAADAIRAIAIRKTRSVDSPGLLPTTHVADRPTPPL